MIAKGRVPVSHPVDKHGAVTSDWNAMVGTAGRGAPDRVWWDDGEDFPLTTDKECMIVLAAPMTFNVGSISYKLAARENYYVTILGGKIVDFQGRTAGGH